MRSRGLAGLGRGRAGSIFAAWAGCRQRAGYACWAPKGPAQPPTVRRVWREGRIVQCERASKRGGAVCIAREQRRSAIDFVKAEHVRRRHSCRCEWLIGWLPASGLQVAGRWEPRPSRSTGLLVQYGLRSTPTKPLGANIVLPGVRESLVLGSELVQVTSVLECKRRVALVCCCCCCCCSRYCCCY